MRTTYGRKELGLPDTPVGPDDVPILLPGETLIVKLPENQVRAYERGRDRNGTPDPTTVELEVQTVKFGDGTSFRGRKGKSWQEGKKDDDPKPRSQVAPGGCKSSEERTRADPFAILQAFYTTEPARGLRAFFLSPPGVVLTLTTSPARDLCGCQSVNGCMWGEFGWSSCPCDDQYPAILSAGGCANQGQCLPYVTSNQYCDTVYNGTQLCTYDDYTGVLAA
jgi:hypothetical protein